MKYGLLIDYDWCTGCHTCEMACQMEQSLPVGQTGIVVSEIGPWKYGESHTDWQISFVPSLTDQCNLCAKRITKGKLPTCVQHCQAKCMTFDTVENLAEKMKEGSKQILLTR